MGGEKIGGVHTEGVNSLWHRFTKLTLLTFEADSSRSNSGWSGSGHGCVRVEVADVDTLLFHEEGEWSQTGGESMRFTNVFRWTKMSRHDSIRLEHLRFGVDRPLYLFDLKSTAPQLWSSCDGHLCRDDVYTAALHVQPNSLDLHWTVHGPAMHESIRYFYS